MSIKVCHITTVHSPFDNRIFNKECKSLEKAGFDVYLITPIEKDKEIGNIKIISIPIPKNRKERLIQTRKIALEKAININADIYHFHDPELIFVGLKLKKLGKKVIYDIHEDVPRQILSKHYLNRFIRPIISKTFEVYENWAAKKFDALITATPHIRDRFIKMNPNTIDINNFPKLEELCPTIPWKNRKNEICYIGGITKIRGILELIKALEYIDTTLHLAGDFENEDLKREIMNLKSWRKVKYYGFIDRNKIREILSNVKIGVVTLHPISRYLYSLPVKMFEYMSAGIPVIASNFPLWENIIENNQYGKCGICVNPLDPNAIASAITYLLNNDREAEKMGKTGYKLIKEKYNWENESKKLVNLYTKILM